MSLSDIWDWLIHANLWIGAGVVVGVIVVIAVFAEVAEFLEQVNKR